MHVKNYSTNVSENSFRGDDLLVHLRSEINKVFDRNAGMWPESPSGTRLSFGKGQSLHLNFTETDDAISIEADMTGFKQGDVNVSMQHQSVIIETCRNDVQRKSYYLGEYSQPSCRWIIPLRCEIGKDSIKTQFSNETLIISVQKKVDIKEFTPFEPA